MITISVNGDTVETTKDITLDKLLKQLGYIEGFAVAINTTFVSISQYKQTIIKNGDKIDILSAIQGG